MVQVDRTFQPDARSGRPGGAIRHRPASSIGRPTRGGRPGPRSIEARQVLNKTSEVVYTDDADPTLRSP
jgi:hypothetical protein